eukprot:scaffold662182_cov122-Attheya_sp.AAC.1
MSSNRNAPVNNSTFDTETNLAGLSRLNQSSNSDDEWSVQVFRWTKPKGWQWYHIPVVTAEDKTNDTKRFERLIAVPRKGCIEVKKIRLRFHLFHPQQQPASAGSSSQKGENDSRTNQTDPPENNALVVQRLDTLLLSTRRNRGEIVLKFRNRSECLSFCDRLMTLNKEEIQKRNLLAQNIPGHHDPSSEISLKNDHQGDPKRRRTSIVPHGFDSHGAMASQTDSSSAISLSAGRHDSDKNVKNSVQNCPQENRRQDVLSYVA